MQREDWTTLKGEEMCEELKEALDAYESKLNQLESKIPEFQKGKMIVVLQFHVKSILKQNHTFFIADVVLYKQLKDESLSLDKWMAEVQKFLTAEEVGWGDIEVLEAQLEQSNVRNNELILHLWKS